MKSPDHKPKKTDTSTRRSKPAPSTSQRQPAAPLQRAVTNPAMATSADILALQRTAGNRAVTQLLSQAANTAKPGGSKPSSIQPKLTVGPVGDKYEQEADRVAESVLRMPEPGNRRASEQGGKGAEEQLQRQPEDEDELGDEVQMKSLADGITPGVQRQPKADGSFAPGSDFESQLSSTQGIGKPLSDATRDDMEGRFGADFGSVRVHTDNESVQMNRDVQAQAFTHGSDIFFGAGKYDTGSTTGKRLLAHELTHVVQQSGRDSGDVAQRKPDIIQREYDWIKKLKGTYIDPDIRERLSVKFVNLPPQERVRFVLKMFEDQTVTTALVDECEKGYAGEQPEFMQAALAWDGSYDEAQTIMDTHIRADSPKEVNLLYYMDGKAMVREFDRLTIGTAPGSDFFEWAIRLVAGDLGKERVDNVIMGTQDAKAFKKLSTVMEHVEMESYLASDEAVDLYQQYNM